MTGALIHITRRSTMLLAVAMIFYVIQSLPSQAASQESDARSSIVAVIQSDDFDAKSNELAGTNGHKPREVEVEKSVFVVEHLEHDAKHEEHCGPQCYSAVSLASVPTDLDIHNRRPDPTVFDMTGHHPGLVKSPPKIHTT